MPDEAVSKRRVPAIGVNGARRHGDVRQAGPGEQRVKAPADHRVPAGMPLQRDLAADRVPRGVAVRVEVGRTVVTLDDRDGPAGPQHVEWKPYADQILAEARARDLRISAIAALYGNPLDPPQTDFARATFRRAIEVAAHIGVTTVAGFAGAIIETELNERGGNLVYKPFENYLPQLLAFWEPLANFAADHGVRIAFEHCPQGAYHLPVMGYNMLGQPAMWDACADK